MERNSDKKKFNKLKKEVSKFYRALDKQIERNINLELQIQEKDELNQQLLSKINNNDNTQNSSKLELSATWITAIVTAIIAFIGFLQWIAFNNQNNLIDKQVDLMKIQNTSLDTQNVLITHQNERIEQQSFLAEAERISELNLLSNSVISDLSKSFQKKKVMKLDKLITARIITLSHYLKPYYYLEAGKLIDYPISPERGLLLVSLINNNICPSSLDEIYSESNFRQSDLININLENEYLKSIDLSGANLRGANLEGANLEKAKLKRANLRGSFVLDIEKETKYKINNGLIRTTNFENSNLKGSVLTNADCRGSNFRGANLSKSNLVNTNFNSAYLEGANFEKANLSQANFKLARLYCTNLKGADLTRVKNITYIQLTQAKSLYNTKGIPEDIVNKIKKSHPHLLEE